MKEHLFSWIELDQNSAQPMAWNYKWIEINLRLHAYVRYRNEQTLDGMEKPIVETLAYVVEIGSSGGWEWRAFKHVDEQVREMDIPYPQQYYRITLQVEEKIQKDLNSAGLSKEEGLQ